MSFRLPTTDQVRILGNDLGMEVTVDYANGFINFIRPFADGAACSLWRCYRQARCAGRYLR